MEKNLRQSINQKWMEAGVTLKDPDTTYIEESVTIGKDTVIGPNTQLCGKTVIGAPLPHRRQCVSHRRRDWG